MEFSKNAVVLVKEPLEGYSPAVIRSWMSAHADEAGIATALAHVSNKTEWLMHDLDELEEPALSLTYTVYDEWWALNKELYETDITILKEENASGKSKHRITKNGLHYVVMPFMERNGYRDGAGWWVKK